MNNGASLHLHLPSGYGELLYRINVLAGKLITISQQQEKMMGLLQDLKAADVAEDAKIDALIAGYKALKQLVADLQAQLAAGATDQAALQDLLDQANASALKIDEALGTGTAPAPADGSTGPT